MAQRFALEHHHAAGVRSDIDDCYGMAVRSTAALGHARHYIKGSRSTILGPRRRPSLPFGSRRPSASFDEREALKSICPVRIDYRIAARRPGATSTGRCGTNPILRSSRDRSSRPLLRSRRDRFSRPRVSAVRFAGLRRSPHRSLGSRIRWHGRAGDRRLLGPPELTEKWLRLAGHRAQKRGGIRELQSLSDTRFEHHDDFTRDCEGYRQPCGRHTECQ